MKKLLLILVSLGLFSCGSVPYYQRENENGIHRIGYTDTKLTDTMYRVSYKDVSIGDPYKKFLMRSSQITINAGYKFFSTKDVGALKENAMNVSFSSGYSSDISLPMYQATIILSNENLPDSFDAAEVLKNNPMPIKNASKP